MEVDVTQKITVRAVRGMALTAIQKGEPAYAPEDNFVVTYRVEGDSVFMSVTELEGVDESKEPVTTFNKAQLMKMTKADLVGLILS